MNAYAWCLATLAAAAVICRAASTTQTQPASSESSSVAVLKTSQGDLLIQPINHSAIRFEFKGKQY